MEGEGGQPCEGGGQVTRELMASIRADGWIWEQVLHISSTGLTGFDSLTKIFLLQQRCASHAARFAWVHTQRVAVCGGERAKQGRGVCSTRILSFDF